MADYSINAITRRVVFTGSAGVGPYAFSFEILDENDVAVYFNTTVLTLTTDYTVTVNANGTGSVTIVTGTNVPSTPTASDTIIIIGARDIERVTDFVTAGDLLASSLNEQLDALTIFDQQLAEEGQRSMRAPVYDPALVADGGTLDMTLPSSSERAGKSLAFDANGNPEAGEDIGTFRGDWASGTTYYKRDIVKDASNDNIYRVNTEHTSSGSTPISTNADAAKFDLIIDAETAFNYANDAEKLAINPEDSQFTLSDGVTTGYSALHHKEKALDAQTAAEAAQASAETAYDNFDDRYLGAKATDPTVDNDGDALITGALYFNTTDGDMRVYNGSAFINVVSSLGNLANIVEDSTPQLGGDLASNGQDILMADDDAVIIGTDTDLTIVHDSGVNNTLFKSDSIEFKSKANDNLTFQLSPGATKAATLYYQGSERLAIEFGTTRFTGGINTDTATIASLAYPTSDGTNGQVLTTNGSGSLSFQDVTITETDPQALAFAIALG